MECKDELAYSYSRLGTAKYISKAIGIYKDIIDAFPNEFTWKYSLGLTHRRAVHGNISTSMPSRQPAAKHIEIAAKYLLDVALNCPEACLRGRAYSQLAVMMNYSEPFFGIDSRRIFREKTVLRLIDEAVRHSPEDAWTLSETGFILSFYDLDKAIVQLEKSLGLKKRALTFHQLESSANLESCCLGGVAIELQIQEIMRTRFFLVILDEYSSRNRSFEFILNYIPNIFTYKSPRVLIGLTDTASTVSVAHKTPSAILKMSTEMYKKELSYLKGITSIFNVKDDDLPKAKLAMIRDKIEQEIEEDESNKEEVHRRNLCTWLEYVLGELNKAKLRNEEVMALTENLNVTALTGRAWIAWETGDRDIFNASLTILEECTSSESDELLEMESKAQIVWVWHIEEK
ncbi:interferon-induced protein with tetratricopeptide repeats 5 [Biomphalaria pfeifferi]|uniref:Interferon-induced protein with tetratricopeptide repeats 5 n=1 Tax=Biomphalaria pfeifferi TaxID=112525 RepID=A0AAD8CD72_BIOPF|nr:interferon-induced protein with tetratricopeptide repeats 5 [Biomphalaria pfeifferi]